MGTFRLDGHFAKRNAAAAGQRPRRSKRRRKLLLESLEARRVLATFVVDTFTDGRTGVCGPDGVGNAGCTLRAAIIAANDLPGADFITLPAGTYSLSIPIGQDPSPLDGDLNITDDLTITGSPTNPSLTVIDAQQVDRVISIESAAGGAPSLNVTLSGLTIQGGLSPNGVPSGGIDASSNTNVTLVDSIVQNNRSDTSVNNFGDADAGGIGTFGNLILTRTTVRDNFAEDFGGGIGVFDNGSLTITDSDFLNNTSGDSGGGIWAGNDAEYQISITGSSFIGNQSTGSEGGGINVEGDDVISTVTLNEVDFQNNRAAFGGGGVNVGEVSSLTITGGTFDSNVSDDAGGGLLVYDNGTVLVDGTRFVGNAAVNGGGGAAVYTAATFRNTLFEQNSVTGQPLPGVVRFDLGGGGIAAAQQSSVRPLLRIEGSSIINNTAALAAGVGAANSFVEIVNSTIEGNQAIGNVGGGGGVGFAQDDVSGTPEARVRLTIVNSTIANNTSDSEAGGIGIADADAQITDSTISGNSASGGRGGGIGFIGFANSPTMLLDRVTIDNNTAGSDGGGIAVQDASFSFVNTTISDNAAAANGGGLAYGSQGSAVTGDVAFSTIASNQSGGFGSNVAVVDAITTFSSTIVADPQGSAPTFNFIAGGPGQLLSQGNNVVSDSSASFTATGDQLDTDPLLGPLQDNGGAVRTRALLAGSPAIDAGGSSQLAVDARNLSRPVDGNADGEAINDVGAFEATQLVISSDLSLAITAETVSGELLPPALIQRGDTLVYRLLVSTTGPDDASNVSVVDTLPVGVTFVSGTLNGSTTGISFDPVTREVTAAVGDVTVAALAEILITVTVDADAADSLLNTAVVSNLPATDPNTNNDSASIVTTLSRIVANDANIDLIEDQPSLVIDLSTLVTVTGTVQPPSFSILSPPGRGIATLNEALLTYESEPDDFTTAPLIVVYAADLGNLSDTGTLTINIAAVNDPPIAADDILTAPDQGDFIIPIATLLANDSAGPLNESQTLVISAVTQPDFGAVVLSGSDVIYTPPAGFSGAATFTYTTTDDEGASATATVNVTVPTDDVVADLSLFVSGPPKVQPGEEIRYTVSLFNAGTSPATNVVVTVDIGVNASLQSADDLTINGLPATAGTFSLVGNKVTLNLAQFNVEDDVFFTITALADPATPGAQVTTTAVISSSVFDPAANDNSSTATTAIIRTHRLSTGSGDGDLTVEVDSMGAFGTSIGDSNQSGAIYDPLGPTLASTTVFDSRLGIRTPVGLHDPLQAANPNITIQNSVSGDLSTAASQFSIGDYSVSLVQTVAPNSNAAGEPIGAALTQTYAFTNTSDASQVLDLTRYVDADLLFDGSLADGGGVLMDAAGNLILFETDKGGVGSTDTTFVGITQSGGQALSSGRFEIDEFSRLRNRVFADGTPLTETIFNDADADGFVDAGSEYDVELALASRFSLAPGATATFVTRTLFGTQPASVAPPAATALSGQVSCDANGNGAVDPSEASSGVTVFVDQNGNRLLDSGEPRATTDSTGTYMFTGLNFAAGQTATVVVQTPPSCAAMAPDIGVTRSLVNTGALSRGIVAADLNNDGAQELLVVNELGDDITVLATNANAGGVSLDSTIQVGKRPVAIAAWQRSASSPPVVAVAAVGTSANKGSIYVIENGQVSRELSAGDGPVSVAVNDFNGDGQPDFVAAALRSGTIVGRMSGESDERVLAAARNPKSITATQVNDDGFTDLVVVSYGFEGDDTSEVVLLLGDGQGSFTPRRLTISGGESIDVAVANFDDDLADEIAIARFGGTVTVFDFVAGAFSSLASVEAQAGVEAIAAGDINQDGRVDIVIANSNVESIEIFVNQPTGFVRNQTITGVPSPSDLLIAHLDSDNVLDVAVSSLYGASDPNFTLPSSATILGLTISEREITFTSNQSVQDFTFRGTTLTPQMAAAWAARPFDVDSSGTISARDALVVINALSRKNRGEAEAGSSKSIFQPDVNRDGQLTALDALLVINHMSRSRRSAEAANDLLAAPEGEAAWRRQQAVDAAMRDAAGLF